MTKNYEMLHKLKELPQKPFSGAKVAYILGFSSGRVKVGCSGSPHTRLRTHHSSYGREGERIEKWWVSPWHAQALDSESQLTEFCRQQLEAVNVQNTYEEFEGVEFNDVLRFAKGILIPVPCFSLRGGLEDNEDFTLPISWLETYLSHLELKNVAVLSVEGGESCPNVRHGDTLLLDRGVNTYKGEGLYLFTHGPATMLRNLILKGNKYEVNSSDGLQYTIGEEDMKDVKIHAKAGGKLFDFKYT